MKNIKKSLNKNGRFSKNKLFIEKEQSKTDCDKSLPTWSAKSN